MAFRHQPPPGHGWAHFVPFSVPESMTINSVHIYSAERTAKATAFSGVSESGEEVLIIGHDAGISSAKPASKPRLEGWHLERLNRDLANRLAEPLYDDVRPAETDPPDFIAERAGRRFGIEVTQLIDEVRRGASGLFDGLKQRIQTTPRSRFRPVEGCVVYVSYWRAEDASRPFKVLDTANDEIIEAIANLRGLADRGWGRAPSVSVVDESAGDQDGGGEL